MARPNGIQAVVSIAVAGACVVAVGFLAGRAISDGGGSEDLGSSSPSDISTRQSAVRVPTLGGGRELPSLDVTQSPPETEVEEGATETGAPSSAVVEGEPSESSPEQEHEVTVAPNG